MKTTEEANQYLKDYVKEKTGYTMRVGEIADFCLDETATEEEIEGYANDYISDMDTEKAAYAVERQAQYDEHFPSELDMSLNY